MASTSLTYEEYLREVNSKLSWVEKILDKTSGVDERQDALAHIQILQLDMMQNILTALGGTPAPLPPTPPLGEYYNVRILPLATARTAASNYEIDISGDYLAAYTDGSFEGAYIRIDSATNDSIPLRSFNKINAPFERIYLTNSAQDGVSLILFYGRGVSADTLGTPEEDIEAKATLHNSTVAAGSTDILSSDITPSNSPSIFRITVALDTATTFFATVDRSGTSVSIYFNAASDLTATAIYVFDVPVRIGDSINFQLGAAATVLLLNVDEITTAGP